MKKSLFILMVLATAMSCKPSVKPNNETDPLTADSLTVRTPDVPSGATLQEYKEKCEYGNNVYWQVTSIHGNSEQGALEKIQKATSQEFFGNCPNIPKGGTAEVMKKIANGKADNCFCVEQTIQYNANGLLSIETHRYTDMEPTDTKTYDLATGELLNWAEEIKWDKDIKAFLFAADNALAAYKRNYPTVDIILFEGSTYIDAQGLHCGWQIKEPVIGEDEICTVEDCWGNCLIPKKEIARFVVDGSPLLRLAK